MGLVRPCDVYHAFPPLSTICPLFPARTTPGTHGWFCPRTFALVQSMCPLDWFCLFKQFLLASLFQGTFMSLLLVPTATSVIFHPKLSLICVYFLTPSRPMRPSTPLESGCQADCLPLPSEDPAHSWCTRNIGGCQAQINKCMHEYMKTASM